MLITPQDPTGDGAIVHLAVSAAAQPPQAGTLRWSGGGQSGQVPLHTIRWEQVPHQHSPLYTARVRLIGLPAGTISVEGQLQGWVAPNAPAVFRTLPSEVPARGAGQGPFCVALASCFYEPRDSAGRIGQLPSALPSSHLPHLKVLCGDQVYLDVPISQRFPSGAADIGTVLAQKYWRTWSHGAAPHDHGFHTFLRWGANWFVSDDHEMWNNYPFATPIARTTWTSAGRGAWTVAANALFDGFQREPGSAGTTRRVMQVGPAGSPGALSILAIDGRLPRTRQLAHHPDDLRYAVKWLANLKNPGALVLSQPLFEPQVSWFRARAQDAGIVDLDDYAPLVSALDAAPHDVLLLSGDIHRGRVAVAKGGSSRSTLWEVVSSPMALCAGTSHGAAPAHPSFPSGPVRGVAARKVETWLQAARDHIATLCFERVGGALQVTVEFWAPGPAHQPFAKTAFLMR